MIRLGRTEVERIAASFAAIPTLQAVLIDLDEAGDPRIVEVEIAEDPSPDRLTSRTDNGTVRS